MLISDSYREQQEIMHKTVPSYGRVAKKYGTRVSSLLDEFELDSILDYGCGHKRSLLRHLYFDRKVEYRCYDPAVPKYAAEPTPAALVCCIDVLEHVEPECLDAVLDHLRDLTQGILFATVHTGAARKKLPDGRNAHLIQQDMEWWLPKFTDRFEIIGTRLDGPHRFEVVAMVKL